MEINIDNIDKIWQQVVLKVRELDANDEQKVDAFLPQLKPQAISPGFIMLTTNNSFIKFWIEGHISGLIKQALQELFNKEFSIQIEVDKSQQNPDYPNNKESLNNFSENSKNLNNTYIAANLVSSNNHKNTNPEEIFTNKSNDVVNNINITETEINLTDLLTFENFVIGSSNNLAFRTALAVAKDPGKPNLNPLFIYGRSGVGKTHLLHAIKNYINTNLIGINSIYIDATAFINEYTDAATAHDIDKSSFQNFRKKYENTHVLLIDDLQLLQNKNQTLNIFFSIFNYLTNIGRQIVISADRAPKNIDVDERYKSRFNNGMSCEITSPEVEVKYGIIKSYIEGFENEEPEIKKYISEDVINYISQNSSSNIRELKSAITKVLYEIKYNHQNLNVNSVKELLEEHFTNKFRKKITVERIQKIVSDFYNINVNYILSKRKDRDIAYARQIAMYLCYKLLDITFSSIGKQFNRDHSTVIHSIKNIEDKIKNNREINEELEILEKKILDSD